MKMSPGKRSHARWVGLALEVSVLGEGGNECRHCRVRLSCLELQQPDIRFARGQLGWNAGGIQQRLGGTNEQNRFAMTILILQKFERVTARAQFVRGVLT